MAQVKTVVDQRCALCHGAQVQQKNVALHTPELIKQHAQNVYQQAVVLKLMPMNNATQITDDERDLIKRWYEAGAPAELISPTHRPPTRRHPEETPMNTPRPSTPWTRSSRLGRVTALGLQHVLVMYAGAIAVPLIVGRALKLTPEQVALLISADLFACGIVTLIQSLGMTRYFGIKLPVMMGVTFAAVGPMVAFANAQRGVEGARAIFGAIIGAGVITMLIAPLMSRMLRFFPPVVTGTIITIIGVSLMRVGVGWAMGGPAFMAQSIDVPKLVEMVEPALAAPVAGVGTGHARSDPDDRQPGLWGARQHGDGCVGAGLRPAAGEIHQGFPGQYLGAAGHRRRLRPGSAWARCTSTRSARRTGSTSSRPSPSACRPSTR